jgi:hypothetical protein
MKQSEEIVSAVGEQLEILIIVGTPGQGPRTFSVAKLDRDRNRDCTYQISEHRKKP